MRLTKPMRLKVDKRVVSGLITARGMTYRSLAAAAGTNPSFVSDLANGKRLDVTEEVASGLEMALQVAPGTLFMQVCMSLDLGAVAA